MPLARHFLVSGRVQGVGFRWFVVDAARRENLCGHVRNLPDGRVEAAAEGEADSLTRFEAALWRGPMRARVDEVQVTDVEPSGAADFLIR